MRGWLPPRRAQALVAAFAARTGKVKAQLDDLEAAKDALDLPAVIDDGPSVVFADRTLLNSFYCLLQRSHTAIW